MLKNIRLWFKDNTKFIRIIAIGYWIYLTYFLLKSANYNSGSFIGGIIEFFKLHDFSYYDKVIHFIIFFILGFFTRYIFGKKIVLGLSIFIAYGALTEILQYCLDNGRSCDIFDFTADVVGVFAGYWTYKLVISNE